MPEIASLIAGGVYGLLIVVSVGLALLAVVFFAQIVLALLPDRASTPASARPRVALLVPAHNESSGILPTLKQARAQMLEGDRLLVVADNCDDDTAEQARSAGAEVTERFNEELRGKGYALDHGVRHLAAMPPDVVVVLDADCALGPDCINIIASRAFSTGRPVQALYLMTAPESKLKMRVAEFAWRVKNWVRPRGMHRIGLPCGLYGTGMAFPWDVAVKAPFASGHLAEDMQLGVRLAELGAPPLFCETASVSSVFPASKEGEKSQRTRWEHGHLSLLFSEGPRLLAKALRRADWRRALQIVDMLIPPLALLAIVQSGVLVLSLASWLIAAWAAPLIVSSVGLLLLITAILLARARFAADVLSLSDMLRAPGYVVAKLSVYASFLVRRQVAWVRTKRDTK